MYIFKVYLLLQFHSLLYFIYFPVTKSILACELPVAVMSENDGPCYNKAQLWSPAARPAVS